MPLLKQSYKQNQAADIGAKQCWKMSHEGGNAG